MTRATAALAPRLDAYAHLPKACSTEAPPVSVVTVCFNAAATLQRTIDSVQRQSMPTEHVFVDGGSRDATLDIIRARLRPQDRLLSEPDRGISDAINKGLAMARGRYVCILHADDWHAPDQLENAVKAIEASRAPFVFGDVLLYVDGKPWFREQGDADYGRVIRQRMASVPHPSILYARDVFSRVGLYRLDLKLAMDYEWLLRATVLGEMGALAPGVVANMTLDGVSNTRYWRTMKEVSDIAISYGYPPLRSRVQLLARYGKTSAGRTLRTLSPGLYQAARKRINPQMQ